MSSYKNRIVLIAFSIILVLFALNGCAPDVTGAIYVFPKSLQRPTTANEKLSEKASAAARGANDFAFKLSKAMLERTSDENFICAPYSIWLPLASLANVTASPEREALLEALSVEDIDVDSLNSAASRMLYDLSRNGRFYGDAKAPLKITTAIFADRQLKIQNDFAQLFMDYYRGKSIQTDFRSQEAVDDINRWITENTSGRISKLVDRFDEDAGVALGCKCGYQLVAKHGR